MKLFIVLALLALAFANSQTNEIEDVVVTRPGSFRGLKHTLPIFPVRTISEEEAVRVSYRGHMMDTADIQKINHPEEEAIRISYRGHMIDSADLQKYLQNGSLLVNNHQEEALDVKKIAGKVEKVAGVVSKVAGAIAGSEEEAIRISYRGHMMDSADVYKFTHPNGEEEAIDVKKIAGKVEKVAGVVSKVAGAIAGSEEEAIRVSYRGHMMDTADIYKLTHPTEEEAIKVSYRGHMIDTADLQKHLQNGHQEEAFDVKKIAGKVEKVAGVVSKVAGAIAGSEEEAIRISYRGHMMDSADVYKFTHPNGEEEALDVKKIAGKVEKVAGVVSKVAGAIAGSQ